MPIIEISSLSHPGVEIFSALTEAQLRNHIELDKGLFIVESPKVIKRALEAGYEPLAILCEHKHIIGDASDIIERYGNDLPVYTGSRELLSKLTGYVLTRGVLCAMHRPILRRVEEICHEARRIVVIDGVVDATNIGAVFRSAAALGMDAVLLRRNSCDPLNRRAVRVSMGAVFCIPWTWMGGSLSDLSNWGFRTAAMALTDNSVSIDDPILMAEFKLAIVVGSEGDGLAHETIAEADYVVRIPMSYGVDSLNVAAAAASRSVSSFHFPISPFIRFLTMEYAFWNKAECSIVCIISWKRCIGITKVSSFVGINGRADGSNIPIKQLRPFFRFSCMAKVTMLQHPDANRVHTASSASLS